MIVSVLTNPALDVIYPVSEIAFGGTSVDVPSKTFPAGKALNVAKTVSTLGEDAQVTGLMPTNDFRRFADYCAQNGLKSSFMQIDGSVRINATIIESKTGQLTHVNSVGGQLSPRVQEDYLNYLLGLMKPNDIWALSGSLPNGLGDNTYMRIIEECRRRNVTTLLDSRGRALSMGVRAKPSMIKPNLSELEEFFGENIEGVRHIALKGKRLVDCGIDYVFVSLGADGLIAIHENDCLLCSLPPIDAVDTVGCGDALLAGIIVGYARAFSFNETARMAVACGASKALHAGPGNISLDEVWRIMEEVKIEAV